MAVYGLLFASLPSSFLLLLITPIAVLTLVVIWALPDTENPPLRSLSYAFAGYFIALVMWPYYLAIQLPGLPLLEIRRLFSALMVLFLLICISTSANFRSEMGRILNSSRTFLTLLLCFVAIQFASAIFSRNPVNSLQQLIKNQISWTAIFFATSYLFSKSGNIRRWIICFVILAICLSAIGMFEYQNQAILWAEHIPSFLRVNDPAMINLLEAVFREGKYRVVTTFSVSLALAEFMALVMPFLIHGIVTAKLPLVRAICLAANVMVFTTILMTQARVGIVGAIVAHSVYGFVWAIQRWRTNKTGLIGPAATLAYPAVSVLLGVAVLSIGRLRVMTLGGGTHSASTQGRMEQFMASGPVLARSPVFGFGPRQGAATLGYTNPAGEMSIDSYILAMLLDYGILGFLLYYGMYIHMIVQAMRVGSRHREGELQFMLPAGVALCVWLASRLVLAQEDNTSLTYMLLGLIAAGVYLARRLEAEPGYGAAVAAQEVKRSR